MVLLHVASFPAVVGVGEILGVLEGEGCLLGVDPQGTKKEETGHQAHVPTAGLWVTYLLLHNKAPQTWACDHNQPLPVCLWSAGADREALQIRGSLSGDDWGSPRCSACLIRQQANPAHCHGEGLGITGSNTQGF